MTDKLGAYRSMVNAHQGGGQRAYYKKSKRAHGCAKIILNISMSTMKKNIRNSLKIGSRDFLVPCIRMLIHSLTGSMRERMFGHYSAMLMREENMKRSLKRRCTKALHMKLCVFIHNSIK